MRFVQVVDGRLNAVTPRAVEEFYNTTFGSLGERRKQVETMLLSKAHADIFDDLRRAEVIVKLRAIQSSDILILTALHKTHRMPIESH